MIFFFFLIFQKALSLNVFYVNELEYRAKEKQIGLTNIYSKIKRFPKEDSLFLVVQDKKHDSKSFEKEFKIFKEADVDATLLNENFFKQADEQREYLACNIPGCTRYKNFSKSGIRISILGFVESSNKMHYDTLDKTANANEDTSKYVNVKSDESIENKVKVIKFHIDLLERTFKPDLIILITNSKERFFEYLKNDKLLLINTESFDKIDDIQDKYMVAKKAPLGSLGLFKLTFRNQEIIDYTNEVKAFKNESIERKKSDDEKLEMSITENKELADFIDKS